MSWKASARHGVREAPAGLALLQDLINTRATMSYGADLLASQDDAQRWLSEALATWSRVVGLPAPVLLLSSTDLRSLRRLRTTFEGVILAGSGRGATQDGALPPADVPVSLVPDAEGWVRMIPAGRGTRWLASALWAEALLAQQAGLWPRLKLCNNLECRAAFFDTSRNNSGVWHDVSTCGNTANLRAFRERKRLMGGTGGQPGPSVQRPDLA
ncbi:CGNR zinc finger domain-containing protein [Pseudosporangium ferrugineum]|uniref:Putative RNA-binding Zn ribbon-like protein n=1 Tax=Pseudosporangium ferrugineum TaxID=439699 RepID=A0A2T0S7N0_9ACTN|nr:CGNR zinc finger domain-containing protein [Pseudosporangium ferrugineum]PRY29313.1 putative RNA-binding Zn ribbon-like protein [Pseudosporangium ferrugineum]